MTHTYAQYISKILTAPVYDVAKKTKLDYAKSLSNRLNNQIFLKREDLQPVFSFKIRGAYNKMAKLTPEQLQKGVITASAGNHAQGVALSAKKMGCQATIVMPTTTPKIKVDAVKSHGANVVLQGVSFNDAYDYAMQLAQESGAVYVPPFDDVDVIAGQGTVGMEINQQRPEKIDAVFVQIGGGGLAAGVAVFLKNIRPEIKVFGVQTEDSCAMKLSIEADEIVALKDVGLFSDGTAVKQVGQLTFEMCRDLLDGVITVNTDEVCGALQDIFTDTRSICEPAGALSLAGLKKYILQNNIENQSFVAITSGANMNFHRLRHVSERSELGEGNEGIFAVTIPEKKGSFLNFVNHLGQRAITEFNYRFGDEKHAQIFVGIQANGAQDIEQISQELNSKGFDTINLSDNEIAKTHIRYMVGGRSQKVLNERLYSFEFPERPGALVKFLTTLKGNWNITLFHYRNHGADYGRILVGIDVPTEDNEAFSEFLKKLDYTFVNQTDNVAYRLFL